MKALLRANWQAVTYTLDPNSIFCASDCFLVRICQQKADDSPALFWQILIESLDSEEVSPWIVVGNPPLLLEESEAHKVLTLQGASLISCTLLSLVMDRAMMRRKGPEEEAWKKTVGKFVFWTRLKVDLNPSVLHWG